MNRSVYNLAGISFTPEMMAEEVKKLIPGFQVEYEPCATRSSIAEQWPRSLDDSSAHEDWGWKYDLTMHDLASKILENIEPKYKHGRTINMSSSQ